MSRQRIISDDKISHARRHHRAQASEAHDLALIDSNSCRGKYCVSLYWYAELATKEKGNGRMLAPHLI